MVDFHEVKSLGVLTIATNHYLEYWFDWFNSTKNHKFFSDDLVRYHIFTNRGEDAKAFLQANNASDFVTIHIIPGLGWPDATLRRYELYENFSKELKEDYLAHLDADMLLIGDTVQSITDLLGNNDIFCVLHPGYWRPIGLRQKKFYWHNLKIFVKDVWLYIRKGGLGAWETNRESKSFVARSRRKSYVAGGFWGGTNGAVQKLVHELHRSVTEDSKKGVMAIWHDESHLNSWASINNPNLIGPTYCFETSYAQLESLSGIIQAVDKGQIEKI